VKAAENLKGAENWRLAAGLCVGGESIEPKEQRVARMAELFRVGAGLAGWWGGEWGSDAPFSHDACAMVLVLFLCAILWENLGPHVWRSPRV
jgi:hypothetical protein